MSLYIYLCTFCFVLLFNISFRIEVIYMNRCSFTLLFLFDWLIKRPFFRGKGVQVNPHEISLILRPKNTALFCVLQPRKQENIVLFLPAIYEMSSLIWGSCKTKYVTCLGGRRLGSKPDFWGDILFAWPQVTHMIAYIMVWSENIQRYIAHSSSSTKRWKQKLFWTRSSGPM